MDGVRTYAPAAKLSRNRRSHCSHLTRRSSLYIRIDFNGTRGYRRTPKLLGRPTYVKRIPSSSPNSVLPYDKNHDGPIFGVISKTMAVANVLKAAVIVGGVVFVLFFIMTVTRTDGQRNEFEKFASTYNKSYANETERNVRFKTFQVRDV